MFESPLHKDSATGAAVIAARWAWFAWRVLTRCLFLVGFLFSWFSTVCFSLGMNTVAPSAWLADAIAFFLNLNCAVVFHLVRYFYILTVANNVLHKPGSSFETRTASDLVSTTRVWPTVRRSSAVASTVLQLARAIATHRLHLRSRSDPRYSVIPISSFLYDTVECWISEQLHVEVVNC